MLVSDNKVALVYRWLLAYIDEKKFSGSQKLPSENALSHRLNVSRETVRAAIDHLVEDGLVYKIKGSGTYFYKEKAISRELGQENKNLLKIGLILQGQDSSANAALIDGIKKSLPADKANISVFLTDNKFDSERRCLQTVLHQNFDGFIVDGVRASIMNPNLDCYEAFERRHIPMIFYNNYYRELRYPRIAVNDMECANLLVGRLVQSGHRRIAGIFVYDNYQSLEKFRGMIACMRKNGVEFRDHYVKWCISDEAHSAKFVRSIEKFLKGLPRCTAIVCCNYIIYRLVCQALANMEKQVPEDYSVVCFDYSGTMLEEDKVTCSVQQSYEMGRQLGKRLMSMILNKECDPIKYSYVMKPVIYEGETIRSI